MTFAALFIRYAWKPIPGCPGRYILREINGPLGLDDLAGGARCFHSPAVPDPVYAAMIPGGGILSYAKGGGRFLHTLNTPAGFRRKLQTLGLATEFFFLPEL